MSTIRYRFRSPHSTGTSDGTGVVTVGHVIGGGLRMSSGKIDIDTSRPFLIPARTFYASWDDVHLGGVNLDWGESEGFARVLTGSDTLRLAFTGVFPLQWTRVLCREFVNVSIS